MIAEYKALEKKVAVHDTFKDVDLQDKYLHLGMPSYGSYSTAAIRAELQRKINECVGGLRPENLSPRQNFSKLKTALIYDAVVNNHDSRLLIKYLEFILSSCDLNPVFEEQSAWQQIILYAKYAQTFESELPPFDPGIFRAEYPREVDTARVMLEMLARGCTIELNDDTIELTSGLEKLIEEMEEAISQLGGLNVIRAIFGQW